MAQDSDPDPCAGHGLPPGFPAARGGPLGFQSPPRLPPDHPLKEGRTVPFVEGHPCGRHRRLALPPGCGLCPDARRDHGVLVRKRREPTAEKVEVAGRDGWCILREESPENDDRHGFECADPNGKIPTIEDRAEGRAIFESGAILWHLAEKYGAFLSEDPVNRSETLQRLFFQVGHVGPMMGQAMYFQRIAMPNGHEEPFSIKRYVDESRRLAEVLNTRLDGRDYLVGDYSIADMATYPWARAYVWARVEVDGLPHPKAWFDRIDARPAVRKALTIPKAQPQFWDAKADDGAFAAENAARFADDVKKR